jgi:hypothetical protein
VAGAPRILPGSLDYCATLTPPVRPASLLGWTATATACAIETGREDVVELLLAAGADLNGSNDQYDDWTPQMLSRHARHSS